MFPARLQTAPSTLTEFAVHGKSRWLFAAVPIRAVPPKLPARVSAVPADRLNCQHRIEAV